MLSLPLKSLPLSHKSGINSLSTWSYIYICVCVCVCVCVYLCMCIYMCVCVCAQSRQILCDPMDCSPPASSVHGISQARILERVAISSSGDYPNSGIEPKSPVSPALAGGFFSTAPSGKPQRGRSGHYIPGAQLTKPTKL